IRFDEGVDGSCDNVSFPRLTLLHCQKMPLHNVVYVCPCQRGFLGKQWEFALKILNEHLPEAAGITLSINQSRHDDHQWKSLLHHRHCNTIMRFPFGTVIFAQVLALEMVALIDHLPMSVRV